MRGAWSQVNVQIWYDEPRGRRGRRNRVGVYVEVAGPHVSQEVAVFQALPEYIHEPGLLLL